MATAIFPISLLDSTRTPTLGCGRHADVVCRAQAGDEDAFSELYVLHKKHVFGICIRMVRNFSLAEDLTQETFLQVHRKIATFRGNSAFKTWLHRMAMNIVLMHLRKRTLATVSLDDLMENPTAERPGRSFGTRDLAQAGVVDRLAIDQVVAKMAPGYRSIFILHELHGLDHDEISSMLNCSRGNTKSQLHKARLVMRCALATKKESAFARRCPGHETPCY